MPTLRLDSLADVSTECFNLAEIKHSVETLARFSNLKVGIRELFCPFIFLLTRQYCNGLMFSGCSCSCPLVGDCTNSTCVHRCVANAVSAMDVLL